MFSYSLSVLFMIECMRVGSNRQQVYMINVLYHFFHIEQSEGQNRTERNVYAGPAEANFLWSGQV